MATTTRGEAFTMYLMGELGFGVRKYEGWLVEHGRKPYAQYPDAPFVKFVPKGKRKPRGWQGSYRPYCVLLRGHGHELEPDSALLPAESTTPGVTVQKSRYSLFDDRWGTDFDAKLGQYLAEKPEALLADYRHKGM